jgi:lipopolysaccharide transport system ATP-binding protein
MVLGYMIKDRLGQPCTAPTPTSRNCRWTTCRPASRCVRFRFAANLGAGSYSVATAIVSTATHLVNNYEWRDLALVFTVVNMRGSHFEGSAWLDPHRNHRT